VLRLLSLGLKERSSGFLRPCSEVPVVAALLNERKIAHELGLALDDGRVSPRIQGRNCLHLVLNSDLPALLFFESASGPGR